jgi:hypothetical protein
MARLPVGAALLLAVAALLPLSACKADTPTCDRAAGLVREAKLSQAADLYATAQRRDEGSCATDGLARVAKLRASSLTATAKGHAAVSAGDPRGAQAAYESALVIDLGNAEAAAGLRRVTRRPATIGPLWYTAQRLHDEGFDEEARAEVLRVLKQHPDETVPESLAHLRDPPPPVSAPAPTPTAAAAAPVVVDGSADGGDGVTWAILGVLVILCGAVGWRALRGIRRSSDRTALALRDIWARAEVLESGMGESKRHLESVVAAVSHIRLQIDDARDAAAQRSTATGSRLTELAAQADRLHLAVQELESTGHNRERQLRQIVLAVSAMRDRDPAVVVEHYARAAPSGRDHDR